MGQFGHGDAVGHVLLGHHQIREFRNVILHRVVQCEFPLFEQHHHGHAGDGLGHGEDAEDRVFSHGHLVLQILPTVGVAVHQSAVAGYQGNDPRQLAVVYFGAQPGLQGSEAVAAHAHLGRVGLGKGALGVLGQRQGGAQAGEDQQQSMTREPAGNGCGVMLYRCHESPKACRGR